MMNDETRLLLRRIGRTEGRGGYGIEYAIERAGATTDEEIAVVQTAFIEGHTHEVSRTLEANLRFGTFERRQALLDAIDALIYDYALVSIENGEADHDER